MIESFIKATHRVRDPVYGYIWLNNTELEIVDTPLFQRLRRIGQLALTKYVYPTAEHSRFVHSLGVLQAATNIFHEILRFNPQAFGTEKEITEKLQILRIAALLHDIGHLPFSHAAEKQILGGFFKHEDMSTNIINNYKPINDILARSNLNFKDVASLIKGNPKPSHLHLKKFISGEFDADRADYLLRDSYMCGVKYGEFDYIRYAGSFRILTDENNQHIFAVEKGNLHAVEAFLLARYHYYLQVPFHRTRRGYDLVLEHYLSELRQRDMLSESGITVQEQSLSVDYQLFESFDDYCVFEQIKKDASNGNQWALILMRQDHLHPVFDTETDNDTNEINFLDLQEELERVERTILGASKVH